MAKTLIVLAGIVQMAMGIAIWVILATTPNAMEINVPLGTITLAGLIVPLMILGAGLAVVGILLLVAGLKDK